MKKQLLVIVSSDFFSSRNKVVHLTSVRHRIHLNSQIKNNNDVYAHEKSTRILKPHVRNTITFESRMFSSSESWHSQSIRDETPDIKKAQHGIFPMQM